MPPFRDLRVKQKITAITLVTILVVSVLSSALYVIIENGRARAAMVKELTTIAGIVADNSTAALVFNDPASADETLAALKAKPEIIGAVIFRKDGSLFASYVAGAAEIPPPFRETANDRMAMAAPNPPVETKSGAGPGHARFHDDLLDLAMPILLDGETVGTLVLRSSLEQIAASLWTHTRIVLAVMLVSLAIAFVLISRMQRVISTPIERLLKTMQTVSEKQDYSVRAVPHGRDELGSVIEGFNHMLAQIQRHEENLHTARRQAETANRAKSDFLANMSHELRTPLNAILGFSEVLMKEIAGPLGQPRYREYAVDIHESGQHLLDLINEILDLSKIEAGRVELLDESIELGALAEKAVRLVADRAAHAGVELRIVGEADLPRLFADERLVKQALLNLLSNAVKFTRRGGRVELRLSSAADGALCLSVCDTGIGIAESDIQRVLTPFCQVESSLSRNYQGTGLGLPLTKSFVEMHDGSFHLTSRLGEGTQATLRFPAKRVLPAAPGEAAAVRPVRPARSA
ncbi:MAG: ATP-binding protein [Kiloniellales bacterium]|jgi:signal transduction histidine kinase|nr:ATP-binding protein [Kiloniellales bacterium]